MNNKRKSLILFALIVIVAIGAYYSFKVYNTYLKSNVTGKQQFMYVKTGFVFEDLISDLRHNDALIDIGTFWEAADKMGLKGKLKPGRYRLQAGMNNRSLINMLKAGNQEALTLKFQNLRTKAAFAGLLGRNLENDSVKFMRYLDSAEFVKQYNFDTTSIFSMFIPNSYQFYWNVSPEDFFKRMHNEYQKFWNQNRLDKAKAINLNPLQVSILASIVDAEALYNKEMPIIAGLYLNRLNKGMLLQADPTVIFANGDFTVKRVTNALLKTESPYNTYKYRGLPPGPINMPSIAAIDAVLNRDNNNYLYMCAKEDFSGYHNFAVTEAEHNVNAQKYRAALNQRKIFK